MEPFLPFLAATIVAAVVAVLGYLVARRAGLGPVQAEYVETLEGINSALDRRIGLLEDEHRSLNDALNTERQARAKLAQKVIRLERTIVSLAEENDYLRQRLGIKRRSGEIDTGDDATDLANPGMAT